MAIIAALFFNKTNPAATLLAMIGGGLITVTLSLLFNDLPFGLNTNLFGILISILLFIIGSYLPDKRLSLKHQ